jgi:hypothetical protein
MRPNNGSPRGQAKSGARICRAGLHPDRRAPAVGPAARSADRSLPAKHAATPRQPVHPRPDTDRKPLPIHRWQPRTLPPICTLQPCAGCSAEGVQMDGIAPACAVIDLHRADRHRPEPVAGVPLVDMYSSSPSQVTSRAAGGISGPVLFTAGWGQLAASGWSSGGRWSAERAGCRGVTGR